MGKKEVYKEDNLKFLQELAVQEEVFALPCGIYYKVLEKGTSTQKPGARSIVTVHYKGSLINGRVFDNSYQRGYPEAFRLTEVIEGWQLALQQMRVGDKWVVYIPIQWDMVVALPVRFRPSQPWFSKSSCWASPNFSRKGLLTLLFLRRMRLYLRPTRVFLYSGIQIARFGPLQRLPVWRVHRVRGLILFLVYPRR